MASRAHLVGSMAFATAERAMRAVGEIGTDTVDWVPDGEPGERRKWMSQHQRRFEALDGLELRGAGAEARQGIISGRVYLGLKDGVRAEDLGITTFGYAESARESYETFAALKRDGAVDPAARFQVAIPPPMEVTASFIAPEDRDDVGPVVEKAFLADLAAILEVIPHDQLAVQWDVAVEIGMLEGVLPTHMPDTFAGVVDGLVRIGDAVPDDVPLAYHFCYGSPYDIHFMEPRDTGLMVRLANALVDGLRRPLDRLHLPVPINREDAAYFAPLRELRIGGAQLYLGLLHHEDGLEGARRRITAARHAIGDGFGVATECGTGRTVAEPMGVLRLHKEAARLLDMPIADEVDVPEQPRPREPVDAERVNADLRAFAEQEPCSTCGADVGEPCRDPDGSLASRPHMDRHHEALLVAVGQQSSHARAES